MTYLQSLNEILQFDNNDAVRSFTILRDAIDVIGLRWNVLLPLEVGFGCRENVQEYRRIRSEINDSDLRTTYKI